MKRLTTLLLPVLVCLPVTASGQARPAPVGMVMPQTAALTVADRQAIVAKLVGALRDRYVFLDVAEKAAARVQAAHAAGDYAALADPNAFAARLTADLAGVAHDKHMKVISLTAPPPGPMRPMARGEGGVFRADRIAGGIGYIEVLGFPPPMIFKRTLDRAMAALAGSRALVIDMRRNGGGSPRSVSYLVSYLVAPGRPINTIVSRTEKTNDYTRESFASEPTPTSFAGVPIYVLTSKDTFSGGEEFAYDVQALKRGTLIGEVTGGGANPVDMVELGHGMAAMIPFGRAENPVTGTNWEGRGVKPDIVVPAADALRTALTKAGGKPAADIAAASVERVFTPRSAPFPGSENALRRIVAGYASGAPDYAMMAADAAAQVRDALPALHSQFAALGALQSVTFNGPDPLGGDEYRLHFAHGTLMMALVLGPQGKVAAISTPMPLPAP
ncbi:MAG: S41 family peptidase [Pseudomonadota bacterium]|nr:S41 family peptidase [Pseudomonadota bacterium]